MGRRRVDHDRLFAGHLFGTARSLTAESEDLQEAVRIVRGMSDGRNDLLAKEAGLWLGVWSLKPSEAPFDMYAVGVLVAAGAWKERDLMLHAIDEGRQNVRETWGIRPVTPAGGSAPEPRLGNFSGIRTALGNLG